MSNQLIILTGVIGAGKTTFADQLEQQFPGLVMAIHADRIQFEATRRAFPFIKKHREYSWRAWPQDPTTMQLDHVFQLALISNYPKLRDHTGTFIVEGCILCLSWFRDEIVNALTHIAPHCAHYTQRRINFVPRVEVVHSQINVRAQNDPYRHHELQAFGTVDQVRQECEKAKARANSGWEHIDCLTQLSQSLYSTVPPQTPLA